MLSLKHICALDSLVAPLANLVGIGIVIVFMTLIRVLSLAKKTADPSWNMFGMCIMPWSKGKIKKSDQGLSRPVNVSHIRCREQGLGYMAKKQTKIQSDLCPPA